MMKCWRIEYKLRDDGVHAYYVWVVAPDVREAVSIVEDASYDNVVVGVDFVGEGMVKDA